jgi:FG-GAP repeat
VKNKAFVLSALSYILLSVSQPARAQVSFFQPPTFAGSGYSLFVGDFNGDGKPDLVTGDGTLNLGKGDGTFVLGANVSGTSGLFVAAVAVDLVVLVYTCTLINC